MNKNTIIGFILIAILVFGFSWYQSHQYKKQVAFRAQQDSIAQAELLAKMMEDSIRRVEHPELYQQNESVVTVVEEENVSEVHSGRNVYKDSTLNVVADAEESKHLLANDKFEIEFTTRGAQPYSVRIKDYETYDSTALYLIGPGLSDYGISVYAGEYINTKDFTFELAELTDNEIAMRLPFSNGGYIEQRYRISEGSYMVENELSFVNMENIIPRNVSTMDIDWNVIIPRFEKGYRNEMQYSQLDYRFPEDKKVHYIGRARDGDKRLNVRVSWFTFHQQFFSAIMRAKNDFSSGNFNLKFFPDSDPNRYLMACSARMSADLDVHSANVTVPFEFYLGPNHYRTLHSYGQKYERIIPLGGSVIGWISRIAIIPSFNFFGRFISNYGIVILLMTILLKLVLSPLTIRSYISSAKMAVLKPEIAKINAKYPKQEDAMKKQQATMNLYKRAGVSMTGGCLPMLLQFPILWAMFRFFPASIELRQQHFLWVQDLSAYDSIWDLPFKIPLYGDHISLFALLMAVSMFFYSRMTSAQMSDDPNMAGMKFMSLWMMPIMMLFICNNLSSALSYYYLLSNLITILQTWLIRKYGVDADKIHAQLAATEGKPMPKSKWQQRLEEAQRMQEQAARQRSNRR